MTNTTLDISYENAVAQEWEAQNVPEINPLSEVDTETLIKAHSKLMTAKVLDIDHALEWIEQTIELLEGTTERDRLAAIYDDLYNLNLSLSGEMEKIRKGWTER